MAKYYKIQRQHLPISIVISINNNHSYNIRPIIKEHKTTQIIPLMKY